MNNLWALAKLAVENDRGCFLCVPSDVCLAPLYLGVTLRSMTPVGVAGATMLPFDDVENVSAHGRKAADRVC